MKISVAMCTYNGEKYIQQQLDSIKFQTITPDELIICDDCSMDNTVAILNPIRRSNLFSSFQRRRLIPL